MKLPTQENIVNSLQHIRNDYCTNCECAEAPDVHDTQCPAFVVVSLHVSEGEWMVVPGDSGFELSAEHNFGTSTVGFHDNAAVFDLVACQLLDDAEDRAFALGLA